MKAVKKLLKNENHGIFIAHLIVDTKCLVTLQPLLGLKPLEVREVI